MTLRRSHFVARVTRFLAVASTVFFWGNTGIAAEPVVLVDAVSMLKGANTSGEFDAVPILLSDIEFESILILTARNGLSAALLPPDTEEWREAKERALIIRLLADQAGRLHETAALEDKEALLGEIVGNMGDAETMNRVLIRIGVQRAALDRWIENAALALKQLRFLREQTTLPSGRSDRHRARQKAASLGNENNRDGNTVVHRYRNMLSKSTGNEALRARLLEIMAENHVRVLR